MEEADFNRFIRLKSQLAIAAKKFGREERLSPVLIATMSKDIEEELKLPQKVIDVVDNANGQICVTLLWYIVERPQSSYTQVRFFPKEKEEEKFQQIVYVN